MTTRRQEEASGWRRRAVSLERLYDRRPPPFVARRAAGGWCRQGGFERNRNEMGLCAK